MRSLLVCFGLLVCLLSEKDRIWSCSSGALHIRPSKLSVALVAKKKEFVLLLNNFEFGDDYSRDVLQKVMLRIDKGFSHDTKLALRTAMATERPLRDPGICGYYLIARMRHNIHNMEGSRHSKLLFNSLRVLFDMVETPALYHIPLSSDDERNASQTPLMPT